MRTCVRGGSATILHADRRVLRVGRAAGRPAPARPAGHRRRRRRAGRQLRGEGAAASARPWAAARRAGSAPTRSWSGRGWRRTPRPARRVFEVFEDTTPLVEGLSIDEAFLDVRGHGAHRRHADRDRRPAAPRGCASEVGLPITVGVARTKFLAKVASAVAKPDGLLVVPPDGELDFLHPLPVERLWGVGAVTAAKLHERGIAHGRRGGRAAGARAGGMLGRGRRAATCTRSPTTATRGAVRRGRRRRSIGSQRALGRAAQSPGEIDTRPGRARRPGHAAPARRPGGSGAPSCCACASTTSRAPPAPTRWPQPTARHATRSSTRRARAARGRAAADRGSAASRSSASPSPTSTTTRRPARAAASTARAAALDAALDEVRDRFGATAVTRAVLLGRDPGLDVPLLPD